MREVQWYIQQNGVRSQGTANLREKRDKEANKQNKCVTKFWYMLWRKRVMKAVIKVAWIKDRI